MGSPFPGMDPYIEATGLWGDFHSHLIEKIAETVADGLPSRYLVRTQERSYLVLVESEGKREHVFVPDVSVSSPSRKKTGGKKGTTTIPRTPRMAEPFLLRAFVEEEFREKFLEIHETSGQRLVTTIEVLSPSNKRRGTPGWDEYLRKRQAAMLGGVHLVELDLLRAGERMPMLDPWPDCPYTLLSARADRSHYCRVWPGYFDQPLPAIEVPLAKPDQDFPLSIQPLIDGIYRRYRYAQSIDYAEPLKPPLTAEEQAWLEQQLRARSR